MVNFTYDPAQCVYRQGDGGNVFPFPEVYGLEELPHGDAVRLGRLVEALDVLHESEASALCVNLLHTTRHQLIHEATYKNINNAMLMPFQDDLDALNSLTI